MARTDNRNDNRRDDRNGNQGDKRPGPTRDELGMMFRDYLVKRADLVQRLMRPKSQLNAMLLIRAAELTFRRDTESKMTDHRTWPTVLVALMTAAQLDLEPGGPLADAHLVPWWDKDLGYHVWSLMPGYRGLVKLAIQSGVVKRMRAFAVYERDVFTIKQGSEPGIIHEVWTGADRGKTIGAYAVARIAGDDGEDESEWMPWAEIEKIKLEQQGRSPAWRSWPDQMARKLPLKRLCNQLPLGERFRLALEVDHAASESNTTALRQAAQSADIDVDTIIDAQATEVKSPTSKTSQMAEKYAQRGDAPPPAEPPREEQRGGDKTTDAECQMCGVPVPAGDTLCASCK